MRLRHALPAGLADAGFASLARLGVGVYAARSLSVSDLGAYALFFSGFIFATIVPMQFVLVPAELATISRARHERVDLLRQAWRIGFPTATAAAVVASIAATLGAEASLSLLWPLALTTTACAMVTPLQEHARRVLHLAGLSWHAAAVSLLQLGGVLVAIALLRAAGVPAIWVPFGALALATVVSLEAGRLLARRRQQLGVLPRYEVAELIRSGRWLLAIEAITAGATFLASVIVTRLDSPEALGYAEAARIVAQPIFVLAVGLSAALSPRSMEAGADRDRGAARRVARPYAVLLAVAGLAYGAVTVVPWWGNPLGAVIPRAYVISGLVPATVAAFVLFGLPIIARSELIGAGRERVLPRVGLIAGILQCATAAFALWIGAFARPLGVALFSAVLVVGYAYHQRVVYRAGGRSLADDERLNARIPAMTVHDSHQSDPTTHETTDSDMEER
jgi:O-antigen/teichoic acid export membrane protein